MEADQPTQALIAGGPINGVRSVAPLLEEEQVGPATIDLRLGTEFIETHRLRKGTLDPLDDEAGPEEDREERVVVPLGDHLMLHPGQFVVGSTLEFVRMPTHMIGQVLGRSSWARLGLIVATAVVVQPGYGGVLTLELVNMGNVPMKLRPGLRVAQLMVWELGEPTDQPYQPSSKYGSPIGPEPSRLGWETGERDRLIRLGRLLAREEQSEGGGAGA